MKKSTKTALWVGGIVLGAIVINRYMKRRNEQTSSFTRGRSRAGVTMSSCPNPNLNCKKQCEDKFGDGAWDSGYGQHGGCNTSGQVMIWSGNSVARRR